MSKVTVGIPAELTEALRVPPDERPGRLRRELAVRLYQKGLLSFGKARELSGMGKLHTQVTETTETAAPQEARAPAQPPSPPRRTKTPVFDALIEEAQRTRAQDLIDSEELARRLGITEEERAEARARIAQRAREEESEEAATCRQGGSESV